MAIISIGNTKGGSGKTTVAILLATAYAAKGASVALLDADPDGRAADWWMVWAQANGYDYTLSAAEEKRILEKPHSYENITIVPSVDQDNILDEVDHYAESHDVVIVDLQGSANQAMLLAFGRSDLVLVPCQPSRFDLKGMAKSIGVVRSASRSTNRSIPYFAILTRTSATAIQTRVDKHTREEIQRLGVPLFGVELGQRTAFQRMSHDGQPPDAALDSAAAENVQALLKEVTRALKSAQSDAAE